MWSEAFGSLGRGGGFVLPLFSFLLGLAMGSFYNVVIYRLPRGISLLRPPSSCPACGERIRPRDNIPLLSYVLLGGKCRNPECRARIPFRYPLVEFLTGVLFAFSCFDALGRGSLPLFFRDSLFYSILLVVSFIDLDHRIIPDELSLGGFVGGLLLEGLLVREYSNPAARMLFHLLGAGGTGSPLFGLNRWTLFSFVDSLAGAAVGGGLLLLTAVAYEKVRKIEGLGMGDVKLLLCVGAFLGPFGALLT
ncbi:MAG: prepilin peptidase, partial [Deltaproteobacteria bacterium]